MKDSFSRSWNIISWKFCHTEAQYSSDKSNLHICGLFWSVHSWSSRNLMSMKKRNDKEGWSKKDANMHLRNRYTTAFKLLWARGLHFDLESAFLSMLGWPSRVYVRPEACMYLKETLEENICQFYALNYLNYAFNYSFCLLLLLLRLASTFCG